MEKNNQRINGNLEHLHRWTDQELVQGIGHASLRLEAAQHDIEAMQAELSGRQPTEEIPVVEQGAFWLDDLGQRTTNEF